MYDKSESILIGLSGAGQEFFKPFDERSLILNQMGMQLIFL